MAMLYEIAVDDIVGDADELVRRLNEKEKNVPKYIRRVWKVVWRGYRGMRNPLMDMEPKYNSMANPCMPTMYG